MKENDLLEGKKVLIVDDEPDILETLEELLDMCEISKATSFHAAKEMLETRPFDMTILDIMGVDGYKLLEIANSRNIPAVMLTAHGLSLENTIKAYKKGAASFVPKEKMSDIHIYLTDLLEAKKEGKHPWRRWLKRFGSYYEKTFAKEWDNYEDFWKKALKGKDQ